MKILFLSDNLVGGGKERRMVELIKGLSLQGGHELYLVSLSDDIYYKDVHKTNCTLKIIKRTPGKGYEFGVQKKIWNYINEIKPDIVHFWGEVGMVYMIPVSFFKRVKTVSSIIADTSPKRGKIKSILRKISFKTTSVILSNTHLGLKNYKAPPIKSKVIYNGFDFDRITDLVSEQEIRRRYNITSKFIVMMVGSYSVRKDYETFLKGTTSLIQKGFDISVITAGYGDFEDLNVFIDKEYSARYLFLPFQDDVESIMNATTVGVLCSNSKVHAEGISNALLEFMAMSKPVIGTNHGGNVELIEPGICGYLIGDKRPDELSEKLELLLTDEQLKSNFSKSSKEIVSTKFSISKMISDFTTLYNNI